jgi:hypothetical protein
MPVQFANPPGCRTRSLRSPQGFRGLRVSTSASWASRRFDVGLREAAGAARPLRRPRGLYATGARLEIRTQQVEGGSDEVGGLLGQLGRPALRRRPAGAAGASTSAARRVDSSIAGCLIERPLRRTPGEHRHETNGSCIVTDRVAASLVPRLSLPLPSARAWPCVPALSSAGLPKQGPVCGRTPLALA